MNKSTLEQTLYSMFLENTGRHMSDSGGAYGRNWERNQGKTIEDFNNQPRATLELKMRENGDIECIGSISAWHHLSACLELDNICHGFNDIPVEDWNGEKAYGLSVSGENYLTNINAVFKESWNTYNWENNLDAVLQGCNIEIDGKSYVLIQYHGGCDIRGGYTDAKLFKIGDWYVDYFLYNDTISGPYFEEIDNGFDVDGTYIVDHNTGTQLPDDLKKCIIKKYNLTPDCDYVKIEDVSASEF